MTDETETAASSGQRRTGAISAALGVVRVLDAHRELLVVHPGGPFFSRRSEGVWSLPKGLVEPGEDPLACALREFREETGFPPPPGPYRTIGEVTLKSRKRVVAWACEGDLDAGAIRSNELELEYPRGSGRLIRFPEVDRAEWVSLDRARALLTAAQVPLAVRAFDLEF